MLLLDMSVKCWVAEVGLGAVATFEVTTLDVIFGATLAFIGSVLVTTVVFVVPVVPVVVSWLALAHIHYRRNLPLILIDSAHHHRNTALGTSWQLRTVLLAVLHHVLPSAVMHVPHLHEVVASPVAIGSRGLVLVHVGHHSLVRGTSIVHHHWLLPHVALV